VLTAEQLRGLVARFDAPQVRAVLLVGSYARGDAGPYSDVDILRLTPSPLPDAGSHLWQDGLLNVTDANQETVEAWFTEPERAVEVVLGLRDARVLLDRRLERWWPELKLSSGRRNCKKKRTAGRARSSSAGRRRLTRVWPVSVRRHGAAAERAVRSVVGAGENGAGATRDALGQRQCLFRRLAEGNGRDALA
jgi:predicted nucleotidyltransferase